MYSAVVYVLQAEVHVPIYALLKIPFLVYAPVSIKSIVCCLARGALWSGYKLDLSVYILYNAVVNFCS